MPDAREHQLQVQRLELDLEPAPDVPGGGDVLGEECGVIVVEPARGRVVRRSLVDHVDAVEQDDPAVGVGDPLPAVDEADPAAEVVLPAVKRLGINLGLNTNYDRPLMKNLVFRNPGFEAQIFQSVIRCASGTAASCVDDNTSTAWTNGFWDGATFEVIWGAGQGRTGVVSAYSPPSGAPAGRLPPAPGSRSVW